MAQLAAAQTDPSRGGQTTQAVPDSSSPQALPQTPSEGVRELQLRLSQLGYYPGPMDGIYGEDTRDAVARFQQAAGLAGTGLPDALTQQRLSDPAAPVSPTASTAPQTPEEPSLLPADGNSAQPSEGLAPDSASNGLSTPNAGEAPSNTAPGTEGAIAQGEFTAPPETEPGTEADTAPDAVPQTPETSAPRTGMLGAALIGVVIAILGALGGGALLLLFRRAHGADSPLDPAEGGEGAEGVVPEGRDIAQDLPLPEPPLGQHNGNHEASVAAALKAPTLNPVELTRIAPMSEESPRLAKVNIIDELIDELGSPDPTLRRKAVWELGQRGNSTAVQPLVNLMVEADSKERSLILAALAEIGTRTLKPMNRALSISLQDENPEVRKNAIRDLSRIYEQMGQVGHMLGHASTDEDPEVQQTAAWALDQLHRMRLTATDTDPTALRGIPRSPEQLPQDSSAHNG